MNIHDYISSGILEAYALGELSEEERSEVENNLARYPELKEELSLIEATQERLFMQTAIPPREAVKAQLFATIDQSKTEAKVVDIHADRSDVRLWKFAAAASVTIALITSYLAYTYHDKWQHTQNDLSDLIAQSQRVASEYNQVNQRLNKIEEDLKIIDNPAFKRVIMNGTPNAPASSAYVYWNENTKEVYLSVQNMKQLSTDTQYQLWAIIDGKPVDAGVFDNTTAGGLLKMKAIGSGTATFAVTIEPRGGNPSPTLETMQVAGNVVKG